MANGRRLSHVKLVEQHIVNGALSNVADDSAGNYMYWVDSRCTIYTTSGPVLLFYKHADQKVGDLAKPLKSLVYRSVSVLVALSDKE